MERYSENFLFFLCAVENALCRLENLFNFEKIIVLCIE